MAIIDFTSNKYLGSTWSYYWTIIPDIYGTGQDTENISLTVEQSTSPIIITATRTISKEGYNSCSSTITVEVPAVDSSTTSGGTDTTHNVTVTRSLIGGGGFEGVIPIDHGYPVSFQVIPNPGYQAVISGDCGGTLLENIYTTNPVYSDCSVNVTFELTGTTGGGSSDKIVTAIFGVGGYLEPGTINPRTLSADQNSVSFSVVLETGYTINNVSVDPSSAATASATGVNILVENVTATCTVNVEFLWDGEIVIAH